MVEYTKEQLRAALDGADRWSVVNVRLGRSPLASGKPLRELAEKYGLDLSGIPYRDPDRGYTDEELTKAVAAGSSWSDVARRLGKPATASTKMMRRTAAQLGLDVEHLRYNYTDQELTAAVAAASSWADVARRLGRRPSGSLARRRAVRLGLDVSHFYRLPCSGKELAKAVAGASSWTDVARRLGKSRSSGSIKLIKAAAGRLNLDVSHLERKRRDLNP